MLTVSEHARAGIVGHFGLAPERVRVVLEAPDPIFRPLDAARDPAELLPALSLPRGARYLLYVGGFGPHKSVHRLIESFQRLSEEPAHAGLTLLLVGDHSGDVFHSEHAALQTMVVARGLQDRVRFAGFIPDEILVDVYNRAELLVLQSGEPVGTGEHTQHYEP